MSLSDLHFLHPWEFKKFADNNDMDYWERTCEFSWAHGKRLLSDFKDRLPAALDVPTANIDALLQWIAEYIEYYFGTPYGACNVYKLTKKV